MSDGTDDSSDIGEQMTRLSAGELGPVASWRLRRRIARTPALQREWAETQRLWTGLAALGALDSAQPVGNRPRWPASDDRPETRPDLIRMGGFAMNRRLAVTLFTASLLTMTGSFAARKINHTHLGSRHTVPVGDVWEITPNYQGQVRFIKAGGGALRMVKINPPNAIGEISATVTWDGITRVVSGVGSHRFTDKQNRLAGYVELSQISQEELDKEQEAAHEKAMGHEDTLSIANGASDGFGIAQGFFGDSPRLTWTLHGVAEVQFRLASNGKIVRRGIAYPVDDTVRKDHQKALSQNDDGDLVADKVPAIPVFEWRVGNGPIQRMEGMATRTLTLPDGTRVTTNLLAVSKTQPKERELHTDISSHANDTEEREEQRKRDRAEGIDERLPHMSTSVTVEEGEKAKVKGSFGSEPDLLVWEMHGIAYLRFRRTDNGKVVLTARSPQPSDSYPNANPSAVPSWEYTYQGKTERLTGFGKFPFKLQDGTRLIAELVPQEKNKPH